MDFGNASLLCPASFTSCSTPHKVGLNALTWSFKTGFSLLLNGAPCIIPLRRFASVKNFSLHPQGFYSRPLSDMLICPRLRLHLPSLASFESRCERAAIAYVLDFSLIDVSSLGWKSRGAGEQRIISNHTWTSNWWTRFDLSSVCLQVSGFSMSQWLWDAL